MTRPAILRAAAFAYWGAANRVRSGQPREGDVEMLSWAAASSSLPERLARDAAAALAAARAMANPGSWA